MPMISAVRLATWADGPWAAPVSVQAKLSRASRMLFMEIHPSSVPGGMRPGFGVSLRRLSRLNNPDFYIPRRVKKFGTPAHGLCLACHDPGQGA